jgi:hypothetical protein
MAGRPGRLAFMKNRSGQILPIALFEVMIFTVFWLAVLNVGKLIKDRIAIQIAADAAAQSACAIRARGLNAIGLLNSWLGTPVFGIGMPKEAWWPAPVHKLDGKTALGKIKEIQEDIRRARKAFKAGANRQGVDRILLVVLKGALAMFATVYDAHPPVAPNWAAKQKAFITLLRDLQEAYNGAYGGGFAAIMALRAARANGADVIYAPLKSYSLRLQRNYGPIWYLSTLHVWYKGKAIAPTPFFPHEEMMEDDPQTRRWYEQGPDFHRKSMKIVAYRQAQSYSLFSIPEMYAVSAARVYNPRGPMFPRSDQTRGLMGGWQALKAYRRASQAWLSQLIPVGGIYEH